MIEQKCGKFREQEKDDFKGEILESQINKFSNSEIKLEK